MKKPATKTRRARTSRKLITKTQRRLLVAYQNHHDLLLQLAETIDAVGTHLGTMAGAGRQGIAVSATEKTFIGYDEALRIVLECTGRAGPEDPAVDPQAPAPTKDQILQCILRKLHDEGFSLPGSLSIGDGETCDAVAAEVQYASN